MATDTGTTTEADAARSARAAAEPDTWPDRLGDRPRGWTEHDEVPSLSELLP